MQRVSCDAFNLPQSGSAEISLTTSDRGGSLGEETQTLSVLCFETGPWLWPEELIQRQFKFIPVRDSHIT